MLPSGTDMLVLGPAFILPVLYHMLMASILYGFGIFSFFFGSSFLPSVINSVINSFVRSLVSHLF